MTDWIDEAGDIRIKSLMGNSMLKNAFQTNADKSAGAEKKMTTELPEVVGTENGLTTIRNGGKTFKIPENLVDKYMMEHSPKAFGGQYD
jgi:hypothetical protein